MTMRAQGDRLRRKLAILADAAKYDASCASSGGERRTSQDGKGLGSTEGMGICHAYAPDGRCISLLKVLLTNVCIYDCAYCINRSSSAVARARFRTEELVQLTLSFYRRNYIEGLFLSSGIIRSPDATMESMIEVVRALRETHNFRGYIHLKTIPDAAPELIEEAGRYADRLSINIELPSERGLERLAPQKSGRVIREAMAWTRLRLEQQEPRKSARRRFAPAGQSTQMIVGADDTTDAQVLRTSAELYAGYALKRVYYSAFSPIISASEALPPSTPALWREHRLYQADWLLRFYDFSLEEIPTGAETGMLDLAIDPKLAWALRNRQRFPLDVNRAPREALLRVPGLGVKVVDRLLRARRHGSLRLDDLRRMGARLGSIRPFLATADHSPSPRLLDSAHLRQRLLGPFQPDLFAHA